MLLCQAMSHSPPMALDTFAIKQHQMYHGTAAVRATAGVRAPTLDKSG